MSVEEKKIQMKAEAESNRQNETSTNNPLLIREQYILPLFVTTEIHSEQRTVPVYYHGQSWLDNTNVSKVLQPRPLQTGVLHTDTSTSLTSSLIVNADLGDGTIKDERHPKRWHISPTQK